MLCRYGRRYTLTCLPKVHQLCMRPEQCNLESQLYENIHIQNHHLCHVITVRRRPENTAIELLWHFISFSCHENFLYLVLLLQM